MRLEISYDPHTKGTSCDDLLVQQVPLLTAVREEADRVVAQRSRCRNDAVRIAMRVVSLDQLAHLHHTDGIETLDCLLAWTERTARLLYSRDPPGLVRGQPCGWQADIASRPTRHWVDLEEPAVDCVTAKMGWGREALWIVRPVLLEPSDALVLLPQVEPWRKTRSRGLPFSVSIWIQKSMPILQRILGQRAWDRLEPIAALR